MTVPPNSGLTLTTHGTADQAAYHYISYADPTTLNAPVANTNFGAAVIGVAYGTTTIPHWTLVNNSVITGYNSGVYLANGGLVDNHATTSSIFGQNGSVFGSYGVQIAGSAGTVVNQGTITAASIGVDVTVGGAIVNGATDNAYALISGTTTGVTAGPATITNFGSIEGQTALYLRHGGTVINTQNVQQHFSNSLAANAAIRGDTLAGIVVANAAGTITNNGIIRGAIGIEGLGTAAVTVLNAGRIGGYNLAGHDLGPAVSLQGGGLIVNAYYTTTVSTGTLGGYADVTLAGRLTGGYSAVAADKPATVVNDSLIEAYGANGVGVDLFAGGTIFNGGAFAHDGTIVANRGIILQGGPGKLDNYAGSLIEATGTYSNSFAVSTDGTVANSGTVTGGGGISDNEAIVGTATILPMIYNSGSIIATYAAVSMLNFGGTSKPAAYIVNAFYGLIEGGNFGVAISGASATVSNLATIKAIHGTGFRYPASGIYLSGSTGTIHNGADTLTSAYIFGKYQGIYAHSSDVTIANYGTIKGSVGVTTYGGTHSNTVANFGTIIGTSSDSVFFGKGNSRLVVGPGAVFVGNVFGNSGNNVLELASATAAGTLKGLSSSFANFATVLVDHGANWYIDGSNFVALTSSGGTVENDGTLNVRTAALFSNFGTIDNIVGTFNVGTSASFSNFVTVTGGVTLESNATLTNTGTAAEISDLGNVILATGTNDIVRNNATLFAYGSIGAGVLLQEGGTVINGGSFNHTAAIDGVKYGISAAHTAVTIGSYGSVVFPDATVTNYATITGTRGVQLDSGGVLANGPGGDTAAVIYGSNLGAHLSGGTITNDGTIGAGRYANAGIFLDKSGAVQNGTPTLTTALITAGANAIIANGYTGLHLYGGAFSISNFGTVTADGLDAIHLVYGVGTIVNGASNSTAALISGNQDGIFDADNQTAYPYIQLEITNFGNIIGTIGVDTRGNTQLTNFGTIIGGGGTAVAFGDNNAWLVDEPGAKFVGHVIAGTGHNTLELAAAVTSGSLLNFGSYYTNFGTLGVDPGTAWDFFGHAVIPSTAALTNDGTMLTGYANDHLTINSAILADAGKHGTISVGKGVVALYGSVDATQLVEFSNPTGLLQLGNTGQFNANIAGFKQGETINLTNIVANQASWSASVLTISSGGIPQAYLTLAGDFTGAQFFVAPAPAGYPGTDVTTNLSCFAAGTRIGTDRGEIAVEDLRFGDRVAPVRGARNYDIVSIARRTIDCRRHPHPQCVWPIRIAAHAFGRNRPRCDLFLSPDHAVFIADVLIPVKHLINGATITQQPRDAITYFHIELPRHDVLLAEGLEVESYLATNAARPELAWEAAACAPLVVAGPILAAVRRRIARLAARRVCAKIAA